MLCYKDRSFCGSAIHTSQYERQITEKKLEDAKRIGLPIAYINFCGN